MHRFTLQSIICTMYMSTAVYTPKMDTPFNSMNAVSLFIGARVTINLHEASIYRLIVHAHSAVALREGKLPITVV